MLRLAIVPQISSQPPSGDNAPARKLFFKLSAISRNDDYQFVAKIGSTEALIATVNRGAGKRPGTTPGE
jgi:hypothetical protein